MCCPLETHVWCTYDIGAADRQRKPRRIRGRGNLPAAKLATRELVIPVTSFQPPSRDIMRNAPCRVYYGFTFLRTRHGLPKEKP